MINIINWKKIAIKNAPLSPYTTLGGVSASSVDLNGDKSPDLLISGTPYLIYGIKDQFSDIKSLKTRIMD